MYVGKLTDVFERAFETSMEFAVVCTSLANTVKPSILLAASTARAGEATARRPTMVLSLNCISNDFLLMVVE
jgi:hypothetical protein